MIHFNSRTALTALALAVGSPALVACSDAAPGDEVESAGTLSAALLTVGTDGATYRLQTGTVIILQKGNFRDEFPLDGTETTLNLRLPTGSFNVQLQFPTGSPQLIRTEGASTQVVEATWLDQPPINVAIAPEATSSLVLHFRVSGLGDVQFDMGNLAVALDVQRADSPLPSQLFESGTYIHSSTVFGVSATPGAQAYFNMTPGESHAHFFDFNITGSWAQFNSEMICAPTMFDAFTTEDGESGFSRSVNSVIKQAGFACIVDNGVSDQFFVNTELLGPGLPPVPAFLPNGSYRFFLSVSGFVGDVYDGQTFQQSNLETFTSFNGGQVLYQAFDFSQNESTVLSQGGLAGNVRLVP